MSHHPRPPATSRGRRLARKFIFHRRNTKKPQTTSMTFQSEGNKHSRKSLRRVISADLSTTSRCCARCGRMKICVKIRLVLTQFELVAQSTWKRLKKIAGRGIAPQDKLHLLAFMWSPSTVVKHCSACRVRDTSCRRMAGSQPQEWKIRRCPNSNSRKRT